MKRETPSAVMFDDLRRFGGITNRDAAWLLLNSKPTNEGKSLRDRVDSRTFLSRTIVHSEPGAIHPEQLVPRLRPQRSDHHRAHNREPQRVDRGAR